MSDKPKDDVWTRRRTVIETDDAVYITEEDGSEHVILRTEMVARALARFQRRKPDSTE